jgi:hypothetical protein
MGSRCPLKRATSSHNDPTAHEIRGFRGIFPRVCKTLMRRFDSDLRLQPLPQQDTHDPLYSCGFRACRMFAPFVQRDATRKPEKPRNGQRNGQRTASPLCGPVPLPGAPSWHVLPPEGIDVAGEGSGAPWCKCAPPTATGSVVAFLIGWSRRGITAGTGQESANPTGQRGMIGNERSVHEGSANGESST